MSSKAACADYFKGQKAWDRCFRQLRRKWESYGRCAGKVILEDCSEEERRALGKLLGRVYWEARVEISLTELEQALQHTRFAPITLEELLEAYFGEKLVPSRERRELREQKRQEFFDTLEAYFSEKGQSVACGEGGQCDEDIQGADGSAAGVRGAEPGQAAGTAGGQADGSAAGYARVCRWLRDMQNTKKYGYAILTRQQEKQYDSAWSLAKNVGEAYVLTETARAAGEPELPLAVLAARITGNPHYFDRGTVAGSLLIHSFCHGQECEVPDTAWGWKEVLAAAGVLPDDIASTVIAYGVHLESAEGSHQAVEAFYRRHEPVILSRLHLKNIQRARGRGGRAYVVENEMVFSYLLDKVKEEPVTLLCTSGQMRTAAMELMQLLADGGTDIYYSGDLDPEGMGIADRLWRRFPQRVHIWRMSREDYEKGISEETLEPRSLSMLKTIANPVLKRTAQAVREKKRAAYQENFLQELVTDLTASDYYSENSKHR